MVVPDKKEIADMIKRNVRENERSKKPYFLAELLRTGLKRKFFAALYIRAMHFNHYYYR